MQHIIHIFTGLQTSGKILDVPFDKRIVGIAKKHIHVFLLARGKIVEAPHPIPELQQRFAKVGTDEPGASRDQKKGTLRKLYILITHAL